MAKIFLIQNYTPFWDLGVSYPPTLHCCKIGWNGWKMPLHSWFLLKLFPDRAKPLFFDPISKKDGPKGVRKDRGRGGEAAASKKSSPSKWHISPIFWKTSFTRFLQLFFSRFSYSVTIMHTWKEKLVLMPILAVVISRTTTIPLLTRINLQVFLVWKRSPFFPSLWGYLVRLTIYFKIFM